MKGKQSKKPLNIQSLILKLAVAWALIAFVVYPNVNLLLGIFFQDGTFPLMQWKRCLSLPEQ